jgi:hypothetical protein
MEESMRYGSEDDGEYRFTSNDLNPFVNTPSAIPNGVSPDELTPEVAQALTRDYSALMAKINEKKGR